MIYRTVDYEGFNMSVLDRRVALVAGPVLAILVAASVAADPGDARQAEGTFVDATGAVVGWLALTEDRHGDVHVNVHVKGISPGLHGIHIHAVGACSPTFAAAGGHYNPLGHQHGLDNPNGPHAGDLPNLVVNDDLVGHLNATTDRVTLSSGAVTLFDADGSAFIIHANPDDQVTDAGNGGSGARIACAVVTADE
jgi:superoxide dismutase, Cu-Zn family